MGKRLVPRKRWIGFLQFYYVPSFFQNYLKMASIEVKQGHGSGLNESFRHWVVNKFAVHEHHIASQAQFSNQPGSNINVWPNSDSLHALREILLYNR